MAIHYYYQIWHFQARRLPVINIIWGIIGAINQKHISSNVKSELLPFQCLLCSIKTSSSQTGKCGLAYIKVEYQQKMPKTVSVIIQYLGKFKRNIRAFPYCLHCVLTIITGSSYQCVQFNSMLLVTKRRNLTGEQSWFSTVQSQSKNVPWPCRAFIATTFMRSGKSTTVHGKIGFLAHKYVQVTPSQ